MDQGLAVETQGPALHAIGVEARIVVKVIEDAVERDQAVGAGIEHDLAQREGDIGAVGQGTGPQVLAQVVGTGNQTRDRFGDDLRQSRHAFRRLDHRPQGNAGPHMGHGAQVVRPVDLRHDEAVNRQVGQRLVDSIERRRMHAHQDMSFLQAAGTQAFGQCRNGGLAITGGDGVLQVEDDHVGLELSRLAHGASIAAGNEQGGTDGHRQLQKGKPRIGRRAAAVKPEIVRFRHLSATTKSLVNKV